MPENPTWKLVKPRATVHAIMRVMQQASKAALEPWALGLGRTLSSWQCQLSNDLGLTYIHVAQGIGICTSLHLERTPFTRQAVSQTWTKHNSGKNVLFSVGHFSKAPPWEGFLTSIRIWVTRWIALPMMSAQITSSHGNAIQGNSPNDSRGDPQTYP